MSSIKIKTKISLIKIWFFSNMKKDALEKIRAISKSIEKKKAIRKTPKEVS